MASCFRECQQALRASLHCHMCLLYICLSVNISLGLCVHKRSVCWAVLWVLLIVDWKYGILFHNLLFSCLSQQIWSVLQIDNLSWHDVHLRQHVTVTDFDIEIMFCTFVQMTLCLDSVGQD